MSRRPHTLHLSAGWRAFTVTELLVVIAIIAVLVALLVVAFNKVRNWSRVAGCQSNQRQIALAQSSYAADNGGAFTSPCTSFRGMDGAFTLDSNCGSFPVVLNNGALTNEAYHSWVASYAGQDSDGNPMLSGNAENEGALKMGRLFSYVGSVPTYRSPLDPTGRLRSYSLNAFVGVTVPNDVSVYGKSWIGWYCAQGVTPRTWISTHLARIKSPSNTMMSIVEQDGQATGRNGHGFVIDPRPPEGSLAPPGVGNPGQWAVAAGWQGWIDTPAMWQPDAVTTSNVDGSTQSYSFQSAAVIATLVEMQAAGHSHSYVQPQDASDGPWRRDWMHFRDRLLPGVIPSMVPRYQQAQ